MNSEYYRNQLYLFLLFLVWPVGAVGLAIRRFMEQHYHFVIVLFGFMFGFSAHPFGGDIVRYAQQFHETAQYNWAEFSQSIIAPLLGTTTGVAKPDVYARSLQFLVSRFTDDQRWFFGFASMIYTFFYINFLRLGLREINWAKSLPQVVFVAFIVFLIPFHFGATGVRFWTAMFIYLICILKFVETRRDKYIMLSATAMLFHYTFLFPFLIFVVFRFVKINRFFTLVLVTGSLGVLLLSSSSSMLSTIDSALVILEDTSVDESAASYTDAEYLEKRKEAAAQRNWYVNINENSIFYFLVILFSLEVFGIFKWEYNEFLRRLFPWLLIFFCLALLTHNLGSIGRFKNIFYLLALLHYAILLGFHLRDKVLKRASYVLIPIFFIHIAVSFRVMFYYIDPLFLIGNPMIMYFYQSGQSLNEFLIGH